MQSTPEQLKMLSQVNSQLIKIPLSAPKKLLSLLALWQIANYQIHLELGVKLFEKLPLRFEKFKIRVQLIYLIKSIKFK